MGGTAASSESSMGDTRKAGTETIVRGVAARFPIRERVAIRGPEARDPEM